MSLTASHLRSLIVAELAHIGDARVTAHVQKLLVDPKPILRDWDYGAPGENYPCWSVLEHPKSNTGIAYCEFGFGPGSPWGLVVLSGPSHMSIGMDSGWYTTFMEVYFASKAATDIPIWRVFKRESGSPSGIPISAESDWDSTWNEAYRLRAFDPSSHYYCSHSVQYPRE